MLLELVKGMLNLFLKGFGIVGNICFFVNYMCSFQGSTEKKCIHFVLIHLTFTNIIILPSKGLPRTTAAFGWRNFLDDVGCKIVFYLSRVATSFSTCTSSLLTVVLAIISPKVSGG
jgi:vomeronasal1 receptor